MRIPGISKPQQQGHHELLSEEVDGKTIFKTHPHGNRAQRRAKQRHHPYFTKTRTGGRLWELGVREQQQRKQKQGVVPPTRWEDKNVKAD